MTVSPHNLLTQPLITTKPRGLVTLPGLLAALVRDEVESFPALRSHQAPNWHMFLVQLAALALHRAGMDDLPKDEAIWTQALRGLTADFPEDEPWRLIVDDWTKPGFMQPPVPEGTKLRNAVFSADALDLLITAKNHDLKQAVARYGQAEDWVCALVSLQTGEGYGGGGHQGIARMNGGSSSRPMLALAPLGSSAEKMITPRPGPWFRRDVATLLEKRDSELEKYDYFARDGIGLTWLAPWPDEAQLQLEELDIWFIEICRRIRLTKNGEDIIGWKGTSKATRIKAKHMNGALGDPYAPVHKTDEKSFTLAGRDFDYHTLTELLLSGNWIPPLLARPTSLDDENETLALVAQALARGNSKTEGFKSRVLPIGGRVQRALARRRDELHELAQQQMETIAIFDKAVRTGLALAAARGNWQKLNNDHYAHARQAGEQFDHAVDAIFFVHLWDRFEAREKGADALKVEELRFAEALKGLAKTTFETALPTIAHAGIFRLRATARAWQAFNAIIRRHFPTLLEADDQEETNFAA